MNRIGGWLALLAVAIICGCTLAQGGSGTKATGDTAKQAPSAVVKSPGMIVFSSNRSGTWRIWSMKQDGSAETKLTEAKQTESDVDPVFSPDCATILFTSTRGGKAGLWTMAADGSNPKRVCDGDQAEWAPDGGSIVLRRDKAIVTRNVASGEEKKLTPKDWPNCSAPSWSPDGKTIAFAARWDKGNGLYLIPAAGGTPTKVYDKEGACEPHWSADSATIVYETTTHIYTIAPDGTSNTPVTYFGGVQRYARYSPDGKLIIFCQGVSENGPWQLYSIPARGGSPVKLTSDGSNMYPDWR